MSGAFHVQPPPPVEHLRALRAEGLTWSQVSARTGMSKRQVQRVFNGVTASKGGRPSRLTEEQKSGIYAAHKAGRNTRDIAAEFGISPCHAYRLIQQKEAGMPVQLEGNADKDATICELRGEGRSWEFIADVIGVSRNAAAERGRFLKARVTRPQSIAPDCRPTSREPLPAGDPFTWGLINAGTCLAGTPFPKWESHHAGR